MYLTKENREFGVSALDAISSLPLFQSSINAKSLATLAGSSVNILINGRRATPEELRNLTGYNIKKVVYYENAPAKFASFFSGPVINVLLNTVNRLEVQGNLRADATSSWNGSGNIGATLLMPRHYLSGAFYLNGLNYDGITDSEIFSYPGLTNSFEIKKGSSRSLNTTTLLSYQWDKGPHMLFANFSYRSFSSRLSHPMEIIEASDDKSIHGSRFSASRQNKYMLNLDLYYTYQFKGGQELSFDLVNGYNKGARTTRNLQTMEEGSAYDDFNNDGDTRNSVYQFVGSAIFSSPLAGGDFSLSLTENYRKLSQQYVNNFFPNLPSANRNDASTTYLSTDYERSFGKLGVVLELSLFHTAMSLSEGGKHHRTKFYPRLTLNYNASDYVSLSLMGWVQSSQNSIGAMNLNRYFIDTRYFGENLPYEREVFKYCAAFDPKISLPSCKLTILPSLWYRYSRHPYVAYIFAEGDNFIKRNLTIPFSHDLTYGLGLSWKPVTGLAFEPYFRGKYVAYNTPVSSVRFNWTTFRMSLSYSKSSFQVSADCTTPTKDMAGIQTAHSGWSGNVMALWKKSSWYVGGGYSFSENASWSITEIPGFSHSQRYALPRQEWLISVMAGYTFNSGKEVRSRRKNKRISNSASETGF